MKKFQERFEKGYDVGTDELYTVWLKMRKLSLKETPSLPAVPEPSHSNPDVRIEADTEVQKSFLDDILVYPSVPESKKRENCF